MNRYNHYNTYTTRGYIYRTLVALGSIAILVFFMPRGNQMKFYFKKGEPWNHGTVIAKDSFSILKTDSALEHDSVLLMQTYTPYYDIHLEQGDKQVEAFKNAFDKTLEGNVPHRYRAHIIDKLRNVYSIGIISTDEYDLQKKNNTTAIMVSIQNNGFRRTMKEVFTPKTAYEYLILDMDSDLYERSVLQRCNLSRYVEPNLTYNKQRSETELKEKLQGFSRFKGSVQAGQKIIDHGDIVDENAYNILRTMQRNLEGRKLTSKERLILLGGHTIYAAIIVLCLLIFFNQFRSDYVQRPRTVMLIVLLTLIFPLMTYALVKHSFMNVYLIPYCILPIFVRVFLDSRTAFITHLSSILLSAIALTSPFEFVVIQSVAGLVAIYSLKDLSQRSELFRAAIQVTLAMMLCRFCFDLIRMNVAMDDSFEYDVYMYLLANGALLLISYLLLIPFERLFKFTSTVTLVELSNSNNEVLRRLSEEAPGTFQHSMQVANLAGEVANTIGAKSQLVRTAALYHDIGKLDAPVFFTENQNGVNPHDNLSYVKSAQIIIGHIKKGLELAEKYQLPEVIRQFIATHHGTSKAKYFYVKYKNENPLLEIDERFFTYPGPNPSTVEQAILMMCDSVEAASRSLPEYTEESIGSLVSKIIDGQMAEGYFANCPITFEDIARAKKVLTQKLMTTYHTRISYPELKNEEEKK